MFVVIAALIGMEKRDGSLYTRVDWIPQWISKKLTHLPSNMIVKAIQFTCKHILWYKLLLSWQPTLSGDLWGTCISSGRSRVACVSLHNHLSFTCSSLIHTSFTSGSLGQQGVQQALHNWRAQRPASKSTYQFFGFQQSLVLFSPLFNRKSPSALAGSQWRHSFFTVNDCCLPLTNFKESKRVRTWKLSIH